MNNFLIRHIRKIIYAGSFLFSLTVYLFNFYTIKNDARFLREVLQAYALSALYLLYAVLLCTPLYQAFPKLPFRGIYVQAKRGLGLSVFYFASLHAYFAFFKYLGGFGSLKYLDAQYLAAISFSSLALLIFTVQAATSNNYSLTRFRGTWKKIHRFVYLASVLVLAHVLIITPKFRKLSVENLIYLILLVFLIALQGIRLYKYLREKPAATAG